jgi:hypothetical protein
MKMDKQDTNDEDEYEVDYAELVAIASLETSNVDEMLDLLLELELNFE